VAHAGVDTVELQLELDRCPSRCSLPVSIESTAISAVTEGVPSSATTIAPLKVPNVPRTLLTTRWRTEKPMDEWTGSMAQVPALSELEVEVVMAASP
jgi:hypothetical protein